MPSYTKDDIILVKLPFSDLSGSKIRPTVDEDDLAAIDRHDTIVRSNRTKFNPQDPDSRLLGEVGNLAFAICSWLPDFPSDSSTPDWFF
jgi:hypothetical protein